jgi:hypothetical protein
MNASLICNEVPEDVLISYAQFDDKGMKLLSEQIQRNYYEPKGAATKSRTFAAQSTHFLLFPGGIAQRKCVDQ